MNKGEEIKVQKKNPGRPKKGLLQPQGVNIGIKKEPDNKNNAIELTIQFQIVLKKFIAMLKSMGVAEMYFVFEPNYVYITAADSVCVSPQQEGFNPNAHIEMKIDASKCDGYYYNYKSKCVFACVHRETVESHCELYNKKQEYKTSITIQASDVENNIANKLYLTTRVSNKSCVFDTITEMPTGVCSAIPYDIGNTVYNVNAYPLVIEMPNETIKCMLQSVSGSGRKISICKVPGSGYTIENQLTNLDGSRETCRFAEDAKAVTKKLASDETITVNFEYHLVKPFINSLYGTSTSLICDGIKNICFQSDNGVYMVQIFVKLIL